MTLDTSIVAAERTEAARHLIDQAQADVVDLVTVSALELCVLGGPRHPLFEEAVARAWMQLGNRRREKVIEWVTEGMIKRGLSRGQPPDRLWQPDSCYSLKPELGIMLAGRCRPAFIVLTETADQNLRTPGSSPSETRPSRSAGSWRNCPRRCPRTGRGFPNVRKLGPLGRFYRYVLLSRDKAAEILAELTISPPQRSGEAMPSAWLVSAYHPDRQSPLGYRLSVRGDGTKARLDGPGDGDPAGTSYDVEGLRRVMFDLITRPSR